MRAILEVPIYNSKWTLNVGTMHPCLPLDSAYAPFLTSAAILCIKPGFDLAPTSSTDVGNADKASARCVLPIQWIECEKDLPASLKVRSNLITWLALSEFWKKRVREIEFCYTLLDIIRRKVDLAGSLVSDYTATN